MTISTWSYWKKEKLATSARKVAANSMMKSQTWLKSNPATTPFSPALTSSLRLARNTRSNLWLSQSCFSWITQASSTFSRQMRWITSYIVFCVIKLGTSPTNSKSCHACTASLSSTTSNLLARVCITPPLNSISSTRSWIGKRWARTSARPTIELKMRCSHLPSTIRRLEFINRRTDHNLLKSNASASETRSLRPLTIMRLRHKNKVLLSP